MSEIVNWEAVASWLRKEASEHVRSANDMMLRGGYQDAQQQSQTADVFMGLARAIDYGIETQELAEKR